MFANGRFRKPADIDGARRTLASNDTRGRLFAETNHAGALKREYLYLNDVLVGVVQ